MTEYVMVPVPEEIAADVAEYLARRVEKPEDPPMDPGSIVDVLGSLDPPCRRLLVLVSESTLADTEITVTDIGSALGCSERETMGMMLEVNHWISAKHVAPFAMMPQEPPGTPPGKFTWNDRIMAMSHRLARAVVAANAGRATPSSGSSLRADVRFTVEDDLGAPVEFECADTIVSRWTCASILEGDTYPFLPFVDGVEVVFDVGGNCGAAAVHFARHYRSASVHVFEPGSEPRAFLERNASVYPNIRVHGIGLHSTDKVVPLYKGDGDTGFGSILKREFNLDESQPVELRNGSRWAAEHGIARIDVLKVDVEGCELDVLAGLAHFLPDVKACYVEYDSTAARKELESIFLPTHELYLATLFLDQGECVYLRKDLADLPGATETLAAIFHRRLHPRSTSA